MIELHSLLKRQLRRFVGNTESLPAGQAELLQAVNEAYLQFDSDRRMLENSLELTSQELLERNAELNRVNTELEMRVAARTTELSNSEARFRGLFDLSPDAVIVIDPHEPNVSWPIIDCNVAACLMNGYGREELIGHSIDILNLTPGTEAERIAYMKQLREAGNLKIETQHRHKNGVVFPVEVSTTLITVGERELVIGIDRDITERRQAEAALTAERDLLQTLMDNIPDLIYFKDTSSRFTRINRAQARFLGVETPEQAIGKTDLDLQNIELALDFYDEEQRLVHTGESVVNRIEFNPTPDGRARWLSTTKVPIKDAAGRVISMVGISHDITQRRQAEEALAAERDLLQALMDNIPDTIYFKDTASRFTRINTAQAKMLGLATPEDAIGKTDLDFQDSELARKFYEEEQHLIETGEPLINRIEFNPTKDGQPRWLTATKVPIKDSNDRVIGLVGVSRDITQRMQAEEALRQSEERFRLMSWATKDAVWDWDLKTHLIWWGEGLQKISYSSSQTAQSSAEWRLDHIHPEDQAKVNRVVHQALEGGMEFWSKEYRFRRNDGTYADVMDRGYIMRDDRGKPYRMIGAMLDITERKQNEETIRHQNNMLSSLHQITLDLLRYRELDPLLSRLVELSVEFMDAPYVEIMLAEGERLVVKAVTQNQPGMIGQRLSRADAMLSWQAFDTREPAVLSNYANWPHRKTIYEEFPLCAVADFPILNDDQCLGVLALGREKPDYEFTFEQIQSGRLFASLTALVLNNAQLREALREQSIRDPLTGLFNRRYLEEALKQQLSRVSRTQHPLGVIMLDIDHFKQVNDTYGHAMGDALLRELGQLLISHVRAEDIACRYGGEEFIVIMPDASLAVTQERAEFLRQAIRMVRVQHGGLLLEGVTLSLGVAVYPQHGQTKDDVLRAADGALYGAKQAGRDRVVVA
jgi:diguanylate cyclase (GGDEF)-like protein/PAS domain S-box-containing protein